MENFDDIINWENLFKQSETFKNNKPFKFAFTEEIFKRDFYERLFETFPKYDKMMKHGLLLLHLQNIYFIEDGAQTKMMMLVKKKIPN